MGVILLSGTFLHNPPQLSRFKLLSDNLSYAILKQTVMFTKTLALSCQKDRKNKYKYACGLMTKQTHTHTHASNDSYEHPPTLTFELEISSTTVQ